MLLLLIGVLPHVVLAQPAPDTSRTLRLSTLLEAVRARNPALEAARLRAGALATRPEQVSALPAPRLGVTYQPRPVLTARGPQRSQWRVEQAIPFPGTRSLRGEIARLEADVAGFEAGALRQDLAFETRRAFYGLYRVQAQIRLIEDFRARLEGFEEAAAVQYEVGRGPQQAILKAQIEAGRLGVRLEQLRTEARSAQTRLARLTSLPQAALRGSVRIDTPLAPVDTTALLARALAERPEARARRRAREQAKQQIALAQKRFWPDFTVSATYFDIAESTALPTADGRDALAVGLGIEIPLWRGKLQANLREARLEARRAEARQEALRLRIETTIRDLAHQLVRQREQRALLEERLLPQSEVALQATLSSYTSGQTDFLDLLDAQRTLLDLRLALVETRARHLTTRAALARAVGVDALDPSP